MATVSFSGPAAGSIVSPAYQKMTLATNYLDFTSSDVFGDGTNVAGWAQQYLPDLYEQEVDRYGNRTISGFLSMLSAEMPLQSDQVIWSEQGRLHLSYTARVTSNNGGIGDGGTGTGTSRITLQKEIDGENVVSNGHGVRVNDTIVVANANGVFKCLVVKVDGAVIDVAPKAMLESVVLFPKVKF
mgnify:CR=1 FL=1